MTVTSGTVTRNGVDIYYEVRGKGPFLVLVPGSYGMSIPYDKAAEYLAADFTVITFDRRGYLRSSKPAPSTKWEDLIIENVHDTAALIQQAASNQAVFIFASSNGAGPAIELLRLYPTLVHKLVLHDPILVDMLGPDSKEPENLQRVVSTYRTQGGAAASQLFIPIATSDSDREAIRASAEYQQLLALVIETYPFFFDCEIDALLAYKTPTVFLKGCRSKICLVTGEMTKTAVTAEPVMGLAKAIECPVNRIVGGHTGYIQYPEEFARDLSTILHLSVNVKRMAKI